MEITEVRIYLAREEQLGGFATVTVDNCLAIHDVKIIEADAAPVYLDALKETQQRHLQGYRSPDEHRGARAHTARGDCGIQKSGGPRGRGWLVCFLEDLLEQSRVILSTIEAQALTDKFNAGASI